MPRKDNASQITDFYSSLGQYLTYQPALRLQEPDREPYLAIPKVTYDSLFQEFLIQKVFEYPPVKLLIYSKATQEINQWIN